LEQVQVQSVVSRVKNRDECIGKFRRKYQESLEKNNLPYEIKDHITDLIGVRVICLYEPDIAKIKKLLEDNFDILDVTDKIKDIESTDNQFGYKSLHLDLQLDKKRKGLPENKQYADLRFEVQIRTIIQDAWGVLDHKIKYKKNIPSELKRRINRLAALFELADEEFNNIRIDTVIPTFPTYQFIHYKADGFVYEILKLDNDFTQKELKEAIDDYLNVVKKFNSEIVFQTPAHYLNPYTMIRHCLYLFNKEKFENILFDIQKQSFKEWLKANKMEGKKA
jgi:ppGpp synthetase/RelA/SpoT-type nucleotidyltranferase